MYHDATERAERAAQRLGQVVNGKYRIDQVLGIGGAAAVFAATHRIGHRVALKMLHREYSKLDEVRSRFRREGYVANRVAHPGIVRIVDDDIDADGSAYLVMDLLTGSTVEAHVEAHGGRLDLDLALGIADAVLDVLSAAHAVSVVHRDIKPGNLFLTHLGDVKVLDFGVARLLDATGITASGGLLGTPAFMPPEQALGERSLDHRCDLWAVGAVIFRLLSGRDVHQAPNEYQRLLRATTTPAEHLGAVAAHVPGAVCDVVDRALAFDQHLRWDTARQMQTALRAARPFESLV
jgi:eukaryotic-like serine/threonine-protein kinase